MNTKSRSAAALMIGLVLAAIGESPAPADLIAAGEAESPSRKLRALFDESWELDLRADPLNATYVGEHRYDDRLPDYSIETRTRRVEAWKSLRTRLAAIDPARLSVDERIDREVLLETLDDRLELEPYRGFLIPFTQQEGLHLAFAQNVNFHPTATAGDLENYIRRLEALPAAVEGVIALLELGMKEKRTPPRATLAMVIPQLRSLAPSDPRKSPLFGIMSRLPADLASERRSEIETRVVAAIETKVNPAFTRWADFLERVYLPACRTSVGLWDTPDGPAHYARLVRSFTTTELKPDEIHRIGLEEVAKTRAAMDDVRRQVGFSGDLDAFLRYLRTDPKFRNSSPEAILARYREILTAMDAKLPLLFGKLPKTDYGLKEIEAYRAKSAAAGYYYPFPEDGSRPGYFYVNTSEPGERTTFSMQALAYHEAVPGHHLQFALTIELADRPAFRRNGYVPAFSEGWGLYSETLPKEVGLYTDPYSEYGRLEYSAWRSARLVVDTGLHHLKWTREQAIDYLVKNSAMPRVEVESEVDRYIAWPGQALAYKVGELEIRRIRAEAEKRLGDRFDVRAFHDRLLSQGSLPLGILRRWMAAEGTEK